MNASPDMAAWFDKQQPIESPALAPSGSEIDRAGRPALTIALINNMPDSALKSTERQFERLVQGAAGDLAVRLRCFSLRSIVRSKRAREHIDNHYGDIAELDHLPIDGMIVTGAEPAAPALPGERYWAELADLIDWAKTRTRSTIWSCLAAHAAVLHLDGIARQRLTRKCSGVYDCATVGESWLTEGLPRSVRVSHSRLNAIEASQLDAAGYRVLTHSAEAGVDIFDRDLGSRFVFFQGHPEYDALSLQREYMRDVARFLSGERADYPAVPVSYFDAATEEILAGFERRARERRRPELAAELPGLKLRADVPAGDTALALFRNWLGFLGADARALSPEIARK